MLCNPIAIHDVACARVLKPRCTCKTSTGFHNEDKKCKLFDAHGVLRYIGFDHGLTRDDVEEVCHLWPSLRGIKWVDVIRVRVVEYE